MKSKTKLSLIVIFIMMVFFTTRTAFGAEESQTIHITFDDDDGFITETGAHFPGGSLVAVLDPSMDIHSWLVFRVVNINSFESLTNATLRLRTASSLPFDADSTITIYGVKDGEFPGFSSPSAVPSYPLTFAHVDYNTSEFYGSGWKEIDVTNIVEELKSSPSWEGDEATFPGTFGFIIEGAEGHDPRYFYDLGAGNGFEAQLVIHWGETPEVDPGDEDPDYNGTGFVWEYVNTTIAYDPGDNETDPWEGEVDIFKVTELGPPEFILTDSPRGWYYNSSWETGITRVWTDTDWSLQTAGVSEVIVSQGDWIYFIGRNTSEDSTRIYWSDDEFETFNTSVRINAHWPFLTGQDSDRGCMWADQNGSATIYVAWMSKTERDAAYQIIFTNFTRNPETGNLTFSPDYFNVTVGMTTEQSDPDMYVQKNGTIHIVWQGRNGTANEIMQYRRRQANETWLPCVRVSSDDVWDSHEGDVVANEETGVALIVWTRVDVGDWDVLWDVVFPNNTVGTLWGTWDRYELNREYVSVVNDRSTNVAHLSYASHSTNRIYYTYKVIDNTTAWAADQQISIGGERFSHNVIGLDEYNDTLAVAFYTLDSGKVTYWNYWNIGDAPTLQNIPLVDYLQYPHSEDYLSLSSLNVTWWLVWPNGTVLPGGGPFDTEDDALEALDDLLGINPLDPTPPSQGWDETGPFTRFRTRLYIFLMGFVMLVGPVMFFAYRRPDGYNFVVGLFIMLIGIGFLISAGTV